MALETFLRPARRTPSSWESKLLEKCRLSLATLEFGLPRELAAAADYFAVGKDGAPMASIYSSGAFADLLENVDHPTINAYVLPHLPLDDADELQRRLSDGDNRFRIANLSRFEAKMAANAKLKRVTDVVEHIADPVAQALADLGSRRDELAKILAADSDVDFDNAAVAALLPLGNAGAQDLLAQWEERLVEARAVAEAARGRVILAVHLACLVFVDEDVFVGEEDVHETILRLAPELHQRIFGDPGHVDPCVEPLSGDDEWDRRQKRTQVAVGRLMRDLGLEMPAMLFVCFSLMRSRRELVEAEGEVFRQELRHHVMRAVQGAATLLEDAACIFQKLTKEFQTYRGRPTLLGNQVNHKDELLPMDSRFYPTYAHLTTEELEEEVRRHTLRSWPGVF